VVSVSSAKRTSERGSTCQIIFEFKMGSEQQVTAQFDRKRASG
jgi:hypothetical protein